MLTKSQLIELKVAIKHFYPQTSVVRLDDGRVAVTKISPHPINPLYLSMLGLPSECTDVSLIRCRYRILCQSFKDLNTN